MKSFLLSGLITALICVFVVCIFDARTRAFFNGLSDTSFIIVAIIFFIGYLLSLYWGITGIMKGQRLFNFMGIGISILGLCIYALGYMMNAGSGKASPGQFDHALGKIEIDQQAALKELLQQTNTKTTDVKFINYWNMYKNPDSFVVCVQKGNIIALQVKNKSVTDIKSVSKLVHLNWLVLENCNLTSIAGLKLPYLQRLAINNNQITSLAGLENEPNVTWLNFQNNPVTDSSALKNHPKKELYILN